MKIQILRIDRRAGKQMVFTEENPSCKMIKAPFRKAHLLSLNDIHPSPRRPCLPLCSRECRVKGAPPISPEAGSTAKILPGIQSAIILHLVLFCTLLFAASCLSKPEEVNRVEKPVYNTHVVESLTFRMPVKATGTLASETQSNLSFMTGGIISKMHVREGNDVKKGMLLAELDLTEIDSRSRQASLALEKATRDYERARALYADSVATLENLQDSKTAVEIARTNLRIAEFNRTHSTITAPSDGKILRRLKEINEVVAPGHPVFAFASSGEGWVLKISLSDRDVVRINVSDSAVIKFDAYPRREFSAVVSGITSSANLLNGTFEAELRLEELPERLVTGLIGSTVIYPPENVYPAIPYISLAEASGNQAWVYLIRNGKPVRTKCTVFSINDEGILIKDGISAGDTIVTEGAAYLR